MITEIKDVNTPIENGVVFFHAKWSGNSCANLKCFTTFAELNSLNPIFLIDVDLDAEITREMYDRGVVHGYGEIAVVKHGQITQTFKYRDWDDTLVGKAVLASWVQA